MGYLTGDLANTEDSSSWATIGIKDATKLMY